MRDFWGPDFEVFVEIDNPDTPGSKQSIRIAPVLLEGIVQWVKESLAHVSCRSVDDAMTKFKAFKRGSS